MDFGTELFALSAAALHADNLLRTAPAAHPRDEFVELVNVIHAEARERIDAAFSSLRHNPDREHHALALARLDGRRAYLDSGIV